MLMTLGNGSTHQYILTDHLNTPRAVVDPTSNANIWRWDITTTVFGEHLAEGDPDGDGNGYTLNLRYPGQFFDSITGVHYNYFRDCDPGVGRYVQSDPIGLKAGLSTYSYVASSAINAFDALGLCQCRAVRVDGIGCQGTKEAFVVPRWFGTERHVECDYDCKFRDDMPTFRIRASHVESYWGGVDGDDGREGVCLGTTFEGPVFNFEMHRDLYTPSGAAWFDPSEETDRGFYSPLLAEWARAFSAGAR